MGRLGFAQAPQVTLLEELQLDMMYWPIKQVEQVWHVALMGMAVPVEYVPAWQSVHWPELLAPVMDWYVPDWQDWQVLTVVEPRMVEYVPVMQAVQATDELTPDPLE